jgi:hypothetical protein
MEGKRIQFGRTQGLLILALGFVLIASQVLISLHLLPGVDQSGANPSVGATPSSDHAMFLIPGILGVITIAIGCYFMLQDKFKNRNIQPPAKTRSGFPM